jgi:alkylation response protein AidB-like acyl-CoA dehydrogenase
VSDAERVSADFVDREWSRDRTLDQWWAAMADAGLSFPHWPADAGGRGWSRDQVAERNRVFKAAGVIGPPRGLGVLMGGPIVIDHGTADQRARFLPALASGREGWCQLFSEPGAGSDLASLATRAVRDGDQWIVTGQKVWTSGATDAARGMLVARTDPSVPKHRGLSYFVVDMRQPGIEIRPLRQMNWAAHFSEVFISEAVVDDADRISDIGNGWAMAVATLAYERSGLSDLGGVGGPMPAAGALAGQLDRSVGDLVDEHRARLRSAADDDAEMAASFGALLALGRARSRDGDALVRQRLARQWTDEAISTAGRRRTGGVASVAKLAWSESLKRARDLGPELLGPAGTLVFDDAPDGGRTIAMTLSVPSASIAGGSDEIQRNVIAERSLGLPKDVAVDRDRPWNEVPR